MTGLRKHVADAIQRDQDCGGAGILTDDEVAAVEWAMLAASRARLVDGNPDAERHRDALAVMLHELGPRRMSIHGAENRGDRYWLHCADVAIDAYDDWLEQRTTAKDPTR